MRKWHKNLLFISLVLLVSLSCATVGSFFEEGSTVDTGQTSDFATQQPTLAPALLPTDTVVPVTPTEEFVFQPGLLFIDEFSERTSGWPVEYTDFTVIDYYQDGYRISVNQVDSLTWSVVGPTLQNVRILVDAKLIGGEEDNYYGIICRYQDANNFYAGVISSDGFYTIMRRFLGGTLEFISSDKFEESVVINQHLDLNLLEFSCVGSQLTLTVNGQVLAQVEDSGIPSGDVGLIVGTISANSTDVLFDNFSLYLEE